MFLKYRNVVFEEGKSYSYVVASSWLGSSIVDISLVWTYAANNYNPFSWFEFFVPSLRIDRIIVSNMETRNKFVSLKIKNSSHILKEVTKSLYHFNRTVICGRDLEISSESFRQFYPDPDC